MPAISESLRAGIASLRGAGADSPGLDARLLLAHALGATVEEILRDEGRQLTRSEETFYNGLLARRAAREPVSRITGRREFWSLEFEINRDTLDPRADSETLITATLDLIKDRNRALRILDIGTGSGCLLLALLSEFPNATGVGADVSMGALFAANANADRLGFAARAQFIHCDLRAVDWRSKCGGPFDLLIANPPYLAEYDFTALAPEVAQHEPRVALAGGADGLDFYRLITISMEYLLAGGGHVVFEVGQGQSAQIASLLFSQGLAVLPPYCDLGGVERAVIGLAPW